MESFKVESINSFVLRNYAVHSILRQIDWRSIGIYSFSSGKQQNKKNETWKAIHFNDTLNIKVDFFFHHHFSRLLIINDNIKAKLSIRAWFAKYSLGTINGAPTILSIDLKKSKVFFSCLTSNTHTHEAYAFVHKKNRLNNIFYESVEISLSWSFMPRMCSGSYRWNRTCSTINSHTQRNLKWFRLLYDSCDDTLN